MDPDLASTDTGLAASSASLVTSSAPVMVGEGRGGIQNDCMLAWPNNSSAGGVMGWGVLAGDGDDPWSRAAADVEGLSLGLSDSEALLFRFLGRD